MSRRTRGALFLSFGAATFLALGCRDPMQPADGAPSPVFAVSSGAFEASGDGAIGHSVALPKMPRQEFDFHVTSPPAGRLFVRDWSIVRSDGSVGSLTVDPTDAATGISHFDQTSAACVTFGGIGRLDTDELRAFSVTACDNGSPGPWRDSFSLSVPELGYSKAARLTEGEIAVTGVTKGDIEVTTVTSGSDLDSDGYTVTLDSTTSQSIGTNASAQFTALAEGTYLVELDGLAANCAVSDGSSRTVSVTAANVSSATFNVTCSGVASGPRATGLGVIGTGPALPGQDRFELDFDVASDLTGRLLIRDFAVMRTNGSAGTMAVDPADPETGMAEFEQSSAACVTFGGVGRLDTGELHPFSVTACDKGSPGAGLDSFSISVPALGYSKSGALTEGEIALTGMTQGDVEVTTVTTGTDLDGDGYTVTLDSTTDRSIGTNASTMFAALPEGTHLVDLSRLASNCTVSDGSSRTVTVTAGNVSRVTFNVTCTAITGTTRATGLGVIGNGVALPGQDRFELDFDVASDLTGRVLVRDYMVTRGDGAAGTMTVDPADSETFISSFSRTSATCVAFGGVGRINENAQLYTFFINACDNANPGAGSDSFSVELPDRPYSKSGILTQGDIAISSTTSS